MIASLLALLLVAGPADVDKAQELYEKARYEKALRALGDTCAEAADPVGCERLRAFVLVALGRKEEALGAFHRMLALNADASLGPDVSPRLQRMFSDAKRGIVGVRDMELEPIDVTEKDAPWGLRAYAPEKQALGRVVAHLAPPGRESFQPVELRSEEDLWVGEIAISDGEAGTARYYLVVTLPSGVEIEVGTETEPREVDVRMLAAVGNGGNGDDNPFDLPPPGGGVQEEGGLPTWAIWSIVGGVAVVAAVGVTLAVVLSGDPEPGTIVVNIGFEDDP